MEACGRCTATKSAKHTLNQRVCLGLWAHRWSRSTTTRHHAPGDDLSALTGAQNERVRLTARTAWGISTSYRTVQAGKRSSLPHAEAAVASTARARRAPCVVKLVAQVAPRHHGICAGNSVERVRPSAWS